MSRYKVGKQVNFRRRKLFDTVQVYLLALLVGMLIGLAV